jgi:hypothetical protein
MGKNMNNVYTKEDSANQNRYTLQIINNKIIWALVCSMVFMSMTASANHDNSRYFYAFGHAATGINDFCGQPIFSLDVPAGFNPLFHASVVGEHDPIGPLPIPLSPTNCDEDIVLATYTDANFLNAVGLPDIDDRIKNIPLKQVPVINNPTGSRGQLPALGNVPGNAFPPTKSDPNETITLGDWLEAFGQMKLVCREDGTAKIKLKLRNLIPNGVYSVWGLWNTVPPGVSGGRIVPLPLGGVPNAIVPNRWGRVNFSRELASCPKDVTPDGSIMMFIDVAFHSDNNLSGIFPQIVGTPTAFNLNGETFSSPLVPGAVTHDHVLFLISGEEL